MKQDIVLTNNEIINIYNWFNSEGASFTDSVNTSVQWALIKNMKKIEETYSLCIQVINQLEDKFSSDDKSEIIINESGEEVRTVKKEFANNFINERLEILKQTNELSISMISINDLPQSMSFNNLNMLSFMILDEDN